MSDQVPRAPALRAFIEDARRADLYTPAQAQNLRVALRLLLVQAQASGVADPEQLTVEEIGARIDELVLAHGQRTGASDSSQQTYASRLRRLVTDFRQHHARAEAQGAESSSVKWRGHVPEAKPATGRCLEQSRRRSRIS